jgi:hypothetical protein
MTSKSKTEYDLDMVSTAHFDHEREFERAWADPRHTRIERSSVDINRVLAEHYKTSEPLKFTRTMLWDVEARKAWQPDLYIPSVVRERSATSWGRLPAPDGTEFFKRTSEQRQWLARDVYRPVLEMVRLNAKQQRVTFIGASAFSDSAGNVLHAGTQQPLFHVEHSVGGSETQPVNLWRIVHLTDRPNDMLHQQDKMRASEFMLPEFVEIYIRDVLNINLDRV